MRNLKFGAVLLIAFIAFGCGLSNTMYNARAYFKSATERPLNSNGKPSPQAVDDYTKAIKKCGIIVTEKKKGKTLEEALFIMAKALYLKGNSSFQAKDQFENLIRLNPDGKYVPEANIYLAKVLRDINKPDESEALLVRFIGDPRFRENHPQALLTLTDFEIQDKDYYRAQYWLEKIIKDYPKNKLYPEAYFLFGKNYYVQKDYTRSLEEFSKLSKLRGLDKNQRLEVQYYIALNNYELGKYPAGMKVIKDVISNEIRIEKLALAKVLRGRLLLKTGDIDKGKAELEAVLKDYPRSQASGYAAYYLAEFVFYQQGDRAAALTNYAKVRTEFPNGEFVTSAQAKIAAITQLNTGARLNSETAIQPFVDYHYLAAENYFSQLNLPDSTFMLYHRVISEKDSLGARLDSLYIVETKLTARIDSLVALLPAVPDSTAKAIDSVSVDDAKPALLDSLSAAADSLFEESAVILVADSTGVVYDPQLDAMTAAETPDSVLAITDTLPVEPIEPELPDSIVVPPDPIDMVIPDPEVALVDSLATEPIIPEIPDPEVVIADTVPADPIDMVIPDHEVALADSLAMDPITAEIPDIPNVSDEQASPSLPDLPDDIFTPLDTILASSDSTAVADSTVVKTGPTIAELQRTKSGLDTELQILQNRIKNLEKIIVRFDDEIIPFVNFAMASDYIKLDRKDPEVADLLADMQEKYPDNKYSNALRQLYNGEPVRVVDPQLERQEKLLEKALGEAESSPDSMLVNLQTLSESDDANIRLKANFRLGWYYAIQEADTLAAQPYFDAVLKDTASGDYGVMTRNFYNGKKFLIYQPEVAKPDSVVADSVQIPDLEELDDAVADSLSGIEANFEDSLQIIDKAIADSLQTPDLEGLDKAVPDSLSGAESSVADSLQIIDKTIADEDLSPEISPPDDPDEGGSIVPDPEPIIIEEPIPIPDPDIPLEEPPLE